MGNAGSGQVPAITTGVCTEGSLNPPSGVALNLRWAAIFVWDGFGGVFVWFWVVFWFFSPGKLIVKSNTVGLQ